MRPLGGPTMEGPDLADRVKLWLRVFYTAYCVYFTRGYVVGLSDEFRFCMT